MITFDITPVSKPRMTQRDRWKPSTAALKFFDFRDKVRRAMKDSQYTPTHILDVKFYLPIPKSWGKGKRKLMNGLPHQQRPDGDNLMKALKDSFFKKEKNLVFIEESEDDCVVWDGHYRKYWIDSEKGKIEIL